MGQDISSKELLPIVLAIATWGQKWRGHHLLCRCDNEAVVCVLAHDTHALTEVPVFSRSILYSVHITASHIAGHANSLADDLSCNRLTSFFTKAPQMSQTPTSLPLMALDLFLNPGLDWSFPAWISLLQTILL